MTYVTTDKAYFKNQETPFTELFSLLKRFQIQPTQIPALAYSSEELLIINKHIDNIIEITLRGLQSVGFMISNNKKLFSDIGVFIAILSNLAEALNTLKIEAEDELKQRKFFS